MSLREAFASLTTDEQAERDLLAHPRAELQLRDKDNRLWGVSGDYRELKFTEKENEPGPITFTVPDDDYYREYFYGFPKGQARPVVVQLPYYRTLWLITDFKRKREGLKRVIEVTGVHCLEYLNWVHLWPCPWFPPEFQPLHYWYGVGPAITTCAAALQANLVRLQGDLFSVPSGNLLDLQNWNLVKKALYPLVVNPRNKLLRDTSTWVTTSWRMDKALDAFKEVCDTEGLTLTTTFFDPDAGDPQPFPEFLVLTRPTLVVDFVEKGPPVGLTGTLADGLFRTAVQLADDLLEWVVYPVLGSDNYDDYLQKAAGLIPGKPFVCYTTGQYSPVPSFEQTTYVGLASRVTAGGKSPEWVNTLLVTGANLAIGYLGTAIGVPGLQLGVFENAVKNKVLAFHSTEDRQRANEGGPWRFRETFAESSSTGLSLTTFAGMKTAHYKSRSYVSHAIEVSNGSPYFAGKDVNVGDPVGVETFDATVEVDRLKELSYEDTRSVRGKLTLQVGSGDAEREPGVLALGKLRRAFQWVNRVALSE
ncbi:minor tail protein [Gordonia phage Sapo]|nr:minor tail protein [Gordonia phage Sapo]